MGFDAGSATLLHSGPNTGAEHLLRDPWSNHNFHHNIAAVQNAVWNGNTAKGEAGKILHSQPTHPVMA